MTEPTLDLPAPSPRRPAPRPPTQRPPTQRPRRRRPGPRPRGATAGRPGRVDPGGGSVLLSEADRAKVDAMVSDYLESVSSLDTHSQAFSDKVKDIAKLGDDDIRASAAVSNRLLEKPLAAMQSGGLTEASEVSHSPSRAARSRTDPAHQGDLLSPRKLLGLILFGDRCATTSTSTAPASTSSTIITTLYHGQDELQRDNAAIEQEKVTLWAVMGRLRQYAYLAQRLDEALSAKVATIEATDPERAKVLKEDLLFYVRQKHQDLLTQLAVSIQGYLALDVVRRNNLELIRASSAPRRPPCRPPDRGHRRPGARRSEACARPDHGAQHDDVEPHRVDLRDVADAVDPDQRAGRLPRPSSSTSCRPRSRTSTRRWTRSTPSRSRRSTRCRRP